MHLLSLITIKQAIEELRAKLGDDAVRIDAEDRQKHGFSIMWAAMDVTADQLPTAVLYPKSTEDVSEIAKTCYKYRIPMVPYSGGPSLEANFLVPYEGLTIDFSVIDRTIAFHESDKNVVVQPGVNWVQLKEQLRHTGLFFPIDPGMPAKIGGMVGTNCSGTHAFRYGAMRDWVVNLTIVLADGNIVKTRRRPPKTSAGYDLTGLLVGSEGTLGLATEITLKLAIIPETIRVGIVTVHDIDDGVSAVTEIVKQGPLLAAVELLDSRAAGYLNTENTSGLVWKEMNTLLLKFAGTSDQVSESVNRVKRILEHATIDSFEFSRDEKEAEKIWSSRKRIATVVGGILMREKLRVVTTDVAVPVSNLSRIIDMTKKDLNLLDLTHAPGIIGHVGDGNFHVGIIYNPLDPVEKESVKMVVNGMIDNAIEIEGTCTGEHGIGAGKKDALIKELGLPAVNIMRDIKRALYPNWLLNPGKVFNYT